MLIKELQEEVQRWRKENENNPMMLMSIGMYEHMASSLPEERQRALYVQLIADRNKVKPE